MESKLNTVDDILHGRILFNRLPPIRPRIIRLYLCALFSDTFNEQNVLYENVFPKLREFSMYRYGLEFQVINFHWGVKENVIDNKLLLQYCLNEIKRSKDYSIGPTFLALLGDTYGEPLLPLKIERVNFENIITSLKDNKINHSLLETYYKLNKNYLVNQYELITDKKFDKIVEKSLFETLKLGCKLAKEKGFKLEDQFNTLEDSIIKKLLDPGAFNNNEKKNKVFTYSRVPINSKLTDKQLETIKEITVNNQIPPEQIYRIRIDTENLSNDKNYLKNFCEHYLKLFKNLIDKFVQQNPEYVYQNSYEDALYHYHYITSNINHDLIAGGENAIKMIRDYIYDTSFRQPLVLTGTMGSGKTSCLATFASTLHLQLMANQTIKKHANDTIIVRFIGADRKSMDLRSLLKSICLQLNAIFVKNSPIPDRFSTLKTYFKDFLIKSEFEGCDPSEYNEDDEPRLILILDSIQDLYENDYAHKLDWLPTYLKANCKVILSVSTESVDLMNRLRSKYTNKRSYVSLNYVEADQAENILQKYLNTNKYRLEDDQMQLVKKFIKNQKTLSLHLKLFSSEILTWKSFSPLESTVVEETLKAAIIKLFSQLEAKHGSYLVKCLLSYLTVSKTGLSEVELQDVLSLDDSLLRNLRDNLKQPNNILIVPFFYILPLIHDLEKHLLIRPDNGLYVIYWRHKLFAEVVYEHYINLDKAFEIQLHVNISEYYLGRWSDNTIKPLEVEDYPVQEKPRETRFSTHTPKKTKFMINTIRLLPKQPLEYEMFHTHIKPRFNLRKFTMLPYHLVKAGMIEKLLTDVYFNIDWLYNRICAFDFQSLLNDFELYKGNTEANLVREALKQAESAILENKNHLFIELTGRLLPYYDEYERIRYLIEQCDHLSLKYNPIVPFRQIYKAPSWILQEEFNMNLHMEDNLQVDLIEDQFHGRILVAKNLGSKMAKFFDLDLMEQKCDIFIGKGLVYCSKDGKYACTIEESQKLIIKRVENGEFYNEVSLGDCDVGQVFLSKKYASLSIRKAPSPIIIDLEKSKIIKTLPYQSSYSCISPDDQILLVHSEDKLNYHKLSDLSRLLSIQSREIPELTVFSKNNSKIYCLSRGTKQVTFYNLLVEKRHYTTTPILQDTDIFEMKLSQDDSKLLICSLQCLYVINAKSDTCELLFKLKPNLPNLSDLKFNDSQSSAYSVLATPTPTPTPSSGTPSFSSLKRIINRNVFNGFGCALNNTIIYATYYTYLFCWDSKTGILLRILQSTPSANRIIKSYSSCFSDYIVSILDNGHFICWNLVNVDKNLNFEDMTLYSNPVVSCSLPKNNFNSQNTSLLAVSFSKQSPDAKLHSLKEKFSVKTVLSAYYDEKIDNPLTAQIETIQLDATGQYCIIIINLEEFQGKRIPEDVDFIKKVATLVDLNDEAIIIEKFSFIVRKNSRLKIKSEFINKSKDEVYLVLQTTSCINDFDQFYSEYDWADFETSIKLYGPIKKLNVNTENYSLPLFDEFKLFGELLNTKICITNNTYIYAALTHECHVMTEKDNPREIIGKRYETHMCVYELFENKKEKMPVQLFDLNEFLTNEEFYHKNILIDIQVIPHGNILLIYSKNGANENTGDKYDYDYTCFEFKRCFKTPKAGIVYDPKENNVLKSFGQFLNEYSDVNKLIVAENNCILDNLWNLYSLETGNVLYRIDKENLYDLDYKYTKFLLNGRYIISTNKKLNKIFILRCYDSKSVASFWLHDKITSLNIGECDRTIAVGTKNGYLLCLKFLIDLEKIEALEKYIKFFRYQNLSNQLENKETKSIDSFAYLSYTNLSSINDTDDDNRFKYQLKDNESINGMNKVNTLTYDLKRMLNSAFEHKRLQSRESSSRARSASIYSTQMSSPVQNIFDDQHAGIVKTNITNLALGVKYTQLNNHTSKACCIQ